MSKRSRGNVSGALLASASAAQARTDAGAAQRAYPWLPARWFVRDRYDNLAKIGAVKVSAVTSAKGAMVTA